VVIITTLSLLILGVLPSFAWLIFFSNEDCHPEPKKLILFTFLSGIIITFFTLQVQVFVNDWLISSGIESFSVYSLLALTGIEEVAKFLAVFFIIFRRREFDEPVDAMIYMIVAALGFAAVENVALVFRSVSDASLGAGAVEIVTLRFVGATLLHLLVSAIVGYYWGLAFKKQISPVFPILWGIIMATVLHAVFNYLIITVDSVIWPVVFLIVIAGFIFRDFETFHDSSKI
jgi:protease PrsW